MIWIKILLVVKRRFEMSTVMENKCKIQEKSIKTKYDAHKDIEKGMPNKHVCEKYEIPSSTLSTWKETKENIFNEFRSNDVNKRQRLNNEKYAQVCSYLQVGFENAIERYHTKWTHN